MPSANERLRTLFPDLDFDPDVLREKYRRERDRRIRSEGGNQYIEAASEFARYAHDDPNADPGFHREPLDLEIDVAVIGAGFPLLPEDCLAAVQNPPEHRLALVELPAHSRPLAPLTGVEERHLSLRAVRGNPALPNCLDLRAELNTRAPTSAST